MSTKQKIHVIPYGDTQENKIEIILTEKKLDVLFKQEKDIIILSIEDLPKLKTIIDQIIKEVK